MEVTANEMVRSRPTPASPAAGPTRRNEPSKTGDSALQAGRYFHHVGIAGDEGEA